jgi:hypothetical protein
MGWRRWVLVLLGLVAAGAVAGGLTVSARGGDGDDHRAAKPGPARPQAKRPVVHRRLRRARRERPNVYAADTPRALTRVSAEALPRVYVPNSGGDTVDVIDPKSYRVVDTSPLARCRSTSRRPTTSARSTWTTTRATP